MQRKTLHCNIDAFSNSLDNSNIFIQNFIFGCSCGFYQFLKLLRMAPITNAEKCRRYRQRHGDKYRKADALRKKHNRVTMKINDPVANEFRLKVQREKKRISKKDFPGNFTKSIVKCQ